MSGFDSLCSKIEARYEEYERKRLSRRHRKREVGAGLPFKLSLEERLLMLPRLLQDERDNPSSWGSSSTSTRATS